MTERTDHKRLADVLYTAFLELPEGARATVDYENTHAEVADGRLVVTTRSGNSPAPAPGIRSKANIPALYWPDAEDPDQQRVTRPGDIHGMKVSVELDGGPACAQTCRYGFKVESSYDVAGGAVYQLEPVSRAFSPKVPVEQVMPPPTHPSIWATDVAAGTCRNILADIIARAVGKSEAKRMLILGALQSEDARKAFALLFADGGQE